MRLNIQETSFHLLETIDDTTPLRERILHWIIKSFWERTHWRYDVNAPNYYTYHTLKIAKSSYRAAKYLYESFRSFWRILYSAMFSFLVYLPIHFFHDNFYRRFLHFIEPRSIARLVPYEYILTFVIRLRHEIV